MSRSPPTIVLEIVDKNTYLVDQIIHSDGLWVVCYENKPINLKSHHYLDSKVIPKYKKTSFSNPGHAINLCKKLNTKFKTTKFTVSIMRIEDQYYP